MLPPDDDDEETEQQQHQLPRIVEYVMDPEAANDMFGPDSYLQVKPTFTCFTRTRVPILTLTRLVPARLLAFLVPTYKYCKSHLYLRYSYKSTNNAANESCNDMFGPVPAAAPYLQRGPLYSVHLSTPTELLNLCLQRPRTCSGNLYTILSAPLYTN